MAENDDQGYAGELRPTLDLWFVVERPLEAEDLYRLRRDVAGEFARLLRERLRGLNPELVDRQFPEPDELLELYLYEGSLRTWLRYTPAAVVLTLQAISGCASQPPSYREEVRQTLEQTAKAIESHVETTTRQAKVPRKPGTEEIDLGEIARIDAALIAYRDGRSSYNDVVAELVNVFVKLNDSPQRAELRAALVSYIDRQYGVTFDWEALRKALPVIPNSSPNAAGEKAPQVSRQRRIVTVFWIEVEVEPLNNAGQLRPMDVRRAIRSEGSDGAPNTQKDIVWEWDVLPAVRSKNVFWIIIAVLGFANLISGALQLPGVLRSYWKIVHTQLIPLLGRRLRPFGKIRRVHIHPGDEAITSLEIEAAKGPIPTTIAEAKDQLARAETAAISPEAKDDLRMVSESVDWSKFDLSQD